ncbi:MAG TPA: right-handed parallel beta-helix repeat-containing protein, partial [Isosphaeraceae bacterium]|nr:right-handed parallel beta-helix repeat-containing protein [Isosphaeraceae bacterium]
IIYPVLLDGTSQPGYAGAPIIQIDGATFTLGNDGLVLAAGSDNSRIRGLDIYGFATGAAIDVRSAGDVIQSNYLGTDVTGTAAGPGNQQGVLVSGSNNTIGGITTSVANIIAFNTGSGVQVDTGTSNVIRQNSVFQNTGAGIHLVNNGNNNQPAPKILTVTTTASSTVISVQLAGSEANALYTLEFFVSASTDPTTGDQAHMFLGSATVKTDSTGSGSFHVTLPGVTTPIGQRVTATATSPPPNAGPPTAQDNDTSPFATSVLVGKSFVVTTVQDNGDDTNPTVGSLRQAIKDANSNPGLDTITFAIPSGPLSINLTASLPAIKDTVVIDGMTQAGFDPTNPATFVTIDGGGLVADGLTLSPGSGGSAIGGGSAIEGLDLTGFTDAAILVQSSNNTIGGTTPGAANSILQANIVHNNTGDGVKVDGGVGDAIRGNSIYRNGKGIVLVNNGNLSQLAPTVQAVNSGAGTTIIQGQLSGFLANTSFVVEFFRSETGDPSVQGQAHVYLGSTQVTTDTSGFVPFTVTLSVSVPVGQVVTATATSAVGNTSQFAQAQGLASLTQVTTTADSGIGSLRQVITNVNASGAAIATQITFAISGVAPFGIALASPLPTITVPVILDGTTQPGFDPTNPATFVTINGAAVSGDGLALGSASTTSSSGSTIKGLAVSGFHGNGIVIQSSNNTIGGTTLLP